MGEEKGAGEGIGERCSVPTVQRPAERFLAVFPMSARGLPAHECPVSLSAVGGLLND